jgi:CheY-like chemotaxis protein
MLLGRQDRGDALVADALSQLVADPAPPSAPPRLQLLRALHDVVRRRREEQPATEPGSGRERLADARLQAMPLLERSVLLLLAVEGLALPAAATVLGISAQEVARIADEAQEAIEHDLETTVLIIEDEWAIARDLRRIVGALGHTVAGVAATCEEAIELAAEFRPGLVVADVQLADGSSGIDAVRAILENEATPAIFVTAFPERLLTGRRPEPTYLITKPFSPGMIKATVSQALFFS